MRFIIRKRKFPIKDRKKAREENSQSKIGRKTKRNKIPNQRFEENKRNIQKRSLDQAISEQYRIIRSKQENKENHDLKWSPPFDCQPKSCALATFLPRTKQKQKRKRPKHSEPNSSPKHNPTLKFNLFYNYIHFF